MFKKIISKATHIAVVQYSRRSQGYHDPSNPEHVAHFHLALVAIEEQKSRREWRILWQALNRPVPAEGDVPAHVEWSLDIREPIDLGKSDACLGGVLIGEVKTDDLDAVKQAIEETALVMGNKRLLNHENAEIFHCRRWTEIVVTQKLIPRGWASPGIASIQSLLPALCEAAIKSSRQGKPAFVEYKP